MAFCACCPSRILLYFHMLVCVCVFIAQAWHERLCKYILSIDASIYNILQIVTWWWWRRWPLGDHLATTWVSGGMSWGCLGGCWWDSTFQYFWVQTVPQRLKNFICDKRRICTFFLCPVLTISWEFYYNIRQFPDHFLSDPITYNFWPHISECHIWYPWTPCF